MGPPGVYLSFSGGKDSTVLRHILKNHCIAVYDCPVDQGGLGMAKVLDYIGVDH